MIILKYGNITSIIGQQFLQRDQTSFLNRVAFSISPSLSWWGFDSSVLSEASQHVEASGSPSLCTWIVPFDTAAIIFISLARLQAITEVLVFLVGLVKVSLILSNTIVWPYVIKISQLFTIPVRFVLCFRFLLFFFVWCFIFRVLVCFFLVTKFVWLILLVVFFLVLLFLPFGFLLVFSFLPFGYFLLCLGMILLFALTSVGITVEMLDVKQI